MRTTIPGVIGDLVLSNKEHGYEEVLKGFDEAEFVTITTFNLSENCDTLLSKLRGLDVPLRIISNIPNRRKGKKDTKQELTDSVSAYLDLLNPEDFGPATSIFFCFSNHAKVVATHKVGYVGSANYSDESAGNWEFGVIVRDSEALAKVMSAVDLIEKDSVRYYGPRVSQAIAPLLAAAKDFRSLHDRLGEGFQEVEDKEVKDAVESLRDAINESDTYLSEGYDGEGAVYDRIESSKLRNIEEWFENELCVWEWRQAQERLAAAENGDVDLPVNNDGVPIDSAHWDIIEERTEECERLAQLVQDEIPYLQTMIDEVVKQIVATCNEVSEGIQKITEIPPAPRKTEEKCPVCAKPMLMRVGKAGSFLGCSGYPECKTLIALDQDGKAKVPAALSKHKCPKCTLAMVLRDGQFGPFLACSGYPKCRVSAKMNNNGEPVFSTESNTSCEKCGKPMMIRPGPRGNFLGCKGYPQCKNAKPLAKS